MSKTWRVIVTGAGSGIGRATVRNFFSAGAEVLAVDRDRVGLETLPDDLDGPGRMVPFVAELTEGDAADRIMAGAKDAFGGLDTLVNNAGIGGSHSALNTTDENWAAQIGVNLTTVFMLSRAALPLLIESQGSIVNTASMAGLLPLMDSAGYSAAKSGVVGLTRQMAGDYGGQGVRVNAVAPGLVESPLTRERIANDARFRTINIDPIPIPRLGTPEDIANGIFFLASDEASYVNGHVLTIDGGWSVTNYSRQGAAMPR